MIRYHERLNLTQAGDWKPILLLVHLELLESDYCSRRLATSSENDSVRPFFDMIQPLDWSEVPVSSHAPCSEIHAGLLTS